MFIGARCKPCFFRMEGYLSWELHVLICGFCAILGHFLVDSCVISGKTGVKKGLILCMDEQTHDFPLDFPCFVHRLYLQGFIFA